MKYTIKPLLVLSFLVAISVACTQSEVVLDKDVAQINEKIGKYEIQIKSAQKMLKKLKEAKRKALINSKLSSKNGAGYATNVAKAEASVRELEGKLGKLEALTNSGPPYKTSTGKTLTKSKVNTLTIKVKTRLNVAKAKLSSAQKVLAVSKKSSKGNAAISEQLGLKIAQLEGKIEILKNNVGLLRDMEDQRKLKNEYDNDLAQGLLKEMDKTISELDSIIEVDIEEVFDEQNKLGGEANNGLSNDDVDLLDEL